MSFRRSTSVLLTAVALGTSLAVTPAVAKEAVPATVTAVSRVVVSEIPSQLDVQFSGNPRVVTQSPTTAASLLSSAFFTIATIASILNSIDTLITFANNYTSNPLPTFNQAFHNLRVQAGSR